MRRIPSATKHESDQVLSITGQVLSVTGQVLSPDLGKIRGVKASCQGWESNLIDHVDTRGQQERCERVTGIPKFGPNM